MNKKLHMWVTTVMCGMAVIALMGTATTSATVPGVNAGIDVNTSNGSPNSNSGNPSVSQDGRYIAFQSRATNLVSPATNGSWQIFVRDRLNGTTVLASVSSGGTQGNGDSIAPSISADGRYVVFESVATNLISGDTNAQRDVFIRDLSAGTTQLVSKSSSGTQGNNISQDADVSADGNYVVFQSYATNLVSSPTVSYGSVYEKNMSTGEVKLLSQTASGSAANADSFAPRISCEGRFVIFVSYANNLVSGDNNNSTKSKSRIYVVDMLKTIDPVYITGSADASMGNGTITCNGNYIGFTSDATNIVSGDTNAVADAFVYDRIKASFERVSLSSAGAEANGASSGPPAVSNDGKYVAFASSATNLVSGDTNGNDDIFLRSRQAGTTELITRSSGGTIGNGNSYQPDISYDGRYVAYGSTANNLVSGFSYVSGAMYTSQTGAANDY